MTATMCAAAPTIIRAAGAGYVVDFDVIDIDVIAVTIRALTDTGAGTLSGSATMRLAGGRWVPDALDLRHNGRLVHRPDVHDRARTHLIAALDSVSDHVGTVRTAAAARHGFEAASRALAVTKARAALDAAERALAREECITALGRHGDPATLEVGLRLLDSGFAGTAEEFIAVAATLAHS